MSASYDYERGTRQEPSLPKRSGAGTTAAAAAVGAPKRSRAEYEESSASSSSESDSPRPKRARSRQESQSDEENEESGGDGSDLSEPEDDLPLYESKGLPSAVPAMHEHADLIRMRKWAVRRPRHRFAAYRHLRHYGVMLINPAARIWAERQERESPEWKNLCFCFVTEDDAVDMSGAGEKGRERALASFKAHAASSVPAAGPAVLDPKLPFERWRADDEDEDEEVSATDPDVEALFEEMYRLVIHRRVESTGLLINRDPGSAYMAACRVSYVGDDGLLIVLTCGDALNARLKDEWIVRAQFCTHCARRQWCDVLACSVPPFSGVDTSDPNEGSVATRWRIKYSEPLAKSVCQSVRTFMRLLHEAAVANAEATTGELTKNFVSAPISKAGLVRGPQFIQHALHKSWEATNK